MSQTTNPGIVYAPWMTVNRPAVSNYTVRRSVSHLYEHVYFKLAKILMEYGFLETPDPHIWLDPIRENRIEIGSHNDGRHWGIMLTDFMGRKYYGNSEDKFVCLLETKPDFNRIR